MGTFGEITLDKKISRYCLFNIFQEHFFTRNIYIYLNQHKILDLSYTQYEISPLKRAIFHIFGHKTTNEKETGQNEEKYLP